MTSQPTTGHQNGLEIAIIGMSGRFPKARNLEEFWQNLRDGVECTTVLSDQELESLGVHAELIRHPQYVKMRATLDDIESFDAPFFGINAREAEIMDPQHRLFLECAWEAFEEAGYDPEAYRGLIGVYAGAGMNSYLFNLGGLNRRSASETYQIFLGNDKDFLTTRVSYKLNLKGPSINVQTACSTSLVAVHLACQALLSGECDMALAGGVSVSVHQRVGYLYEERMITSPDGHCRAFDARARGTIFGGGLGLVVLKRLGDAQVAGDHVHAVIKGSAINNDGALKAGYTAPSVEGQAAVVRAAQMMAEVEADTVSYIETHGTGTELGDPIEISALTKAFRAGTKKKNFCAIGSLKTNIGHTDTAAGVAGLIKTVLSLKHKQILPSLNFEEPNPAIDFVNSPFYVNTRLTQWKSNGSPRRAGVSSFGIGGTNAHVILEESPEPERGSQSRPRQLLLLSAKTTTALDMRTSKLVQHLRTNPGLNIADVAYTLQLGRKAFGQRRMLVCRDVDDAREALATKDPDRVYSAAPERTERPVAFLFPGQGSQYVGMAQELYVTEPTFREQIDLCVELLKPHMEFDLREVIYPQELGKRSQGVIDNRSPLDQTRVTQPALFVIEYALAKLWMEWGVRPQAMIGHSIGEYVAACLAGVFSLEDALQIVAARGRLMQRTPGGDMLSVGLTEEQVKPWLSSDLSLAAVNAPVVCVVAGTSEAVSALERQLTARDVACHRLHTSHAFHSQMMEPVLESFARLVERIKLHPPAIPYLSNVSGTWITEVDATAPSYWSRHLRQPVRFSDGVRELLKDSNLAVLEVGPGQTLTNLVRRNIENGGNHVILPSLRRPQEPQSDVSFILRTLGKLWLAGVKIDWEAFHNHERRLRVALPTYPFERRRYWIEPEQKSHADESQPPSLGKKSDVADWFYAPSWKRSLPLQIVQRDDSADKLLWLVFMDEGGLAAEIVRRLERDGQKVITVKAGNKFHHAGAMAYTINPRVRGDYEKLISELRANRSIPERVIHLWSVTRNDDFGSSEVERFETMQYAGFYSLLFLAGALKRQHVTDNLDIAVISNGLHEVSGSSFLQPEKATLLGPCKVIPQECPNITCRSIDIEMPTTTKISNFVIDQLMLELLSKATEPIIAYRGNHRWLQIFESLRPKASIGIPAKLREGGVYLITGGLGNIGFTFAEYLASAVKAKLVLVSRSAIPARDRWADYFQSHNGENGVSSKIRRISDLERAGAEVLTVSADVSDEKQMAAVIARATEHFGVIHGVIHAAGIVSVQSNFLIDEAESEQCAAHFRPKVHGLFALEKLLRRRQIDFCLLTSSLSSVLGGLGLSAYAAANLFMDAFAYKCNQAGDVPWMSVNYDAWNFAERSESVHGFGAALARLAMAPKEGIEVFKRVLSVGAANQIIVSTGDLSARIDQWIRRQSLRDTDTPRRKVGSMVSSTFYSRPEISSAYASPISETEQILAGIWGQALGIEQVGSRDNFFDLGGDSLLAVQVVSKLEKALGIRVHHGELIFQTLEQLAAVCDERMRSGEGLQPVTFTRRLLNPLKQVASIISGNSRDPEQST